MNSGITGISRAGRGKLSSIPPEEIDLDVTYEIAASLVRFRAATLELLLGIPWPIALPIVLTAERVRRYLTCVKTTVSSKGQIVLPAEFRLIDRIEPGQEFDVERLDRGDYRLVRRAAPRNEGAIDWLLACPHKDFFVPIDSESTDTL